MWHQLRLLEELPWTITEQGALLCELTGHNLLKGNGQRTVCVCVCVILLSPQRPFAHAFMRQPSIHTAVASRAFWDSVSCPIGLFDMRTGGAGDQPADLPLCEDTRSDPRPHCSQHYRMCDPSLQAPPSAASLTATKQPACFSLSKNPCRALGHNESNYNSSL